MMRCLLTANLYLLCALWVQSAQEGGFDYRMRLTDETGEALIRKYTPMARPPVHGDPSAEPRDGFIHLTDDPRDPRAEQMREFYEWFKESPYAAREFQRHVRRAHTYIQQGEFERAGIEAHLGLSLVPDDLTLLFLAGRIHARRGLYSRADEYWSRLVELEPDNVAFLAGRGGVLVRMGRLAEAESLLKRANEMQPYYTPTLFNLACLYITGDRQDELHDALGSLTSQDIAQMADWLAEEHDELLALLGEAGYLLLGHYFLRGGDRPAENPPASSAGAVSPDFLVFSPSGETPERLFDGGQTGIADVETMRLRLRSASRLLTALGRAMQQEQWADAARIGAAPEIAAWGLTASAVRADALYSRYRSGEPDARSDLRRLLRRHPDGLIARMRLATAWMDEGDYDEAESLLRACDARYPRHLGTQMLLACALAEQGKESDAVSVLNELNPRWQPVIRGWFAVESPYKRNILSADAYAAWRAAFDVLHTDANQPGETP